MEVAMRLALASLALVLAGCSGPEPKAAPPEPRAAPVKGAVISLGRDGATPIAARAPLVFSRDGSLLAVGFSSGGVRLFDGRTGARRGDFRASKEGLCALAFSPDGALLATGGYDASIRIWRLPAGEAAGGWETSPNAPLSPPVNPTPDHGNTILTLAFSPDGASLASQSLDGTVRLFDAARGREIWRHEGHAHFPTALAFGPDGRMLASADEGGIVLLWDPASGEKLRTIETPAAKAAAKDPTNGDADLLTAIRALGFSDSGALLATAGDDDRVHLWKVETGEEARALAHGETVRAVRFASEREGTLVSASDDGTLCTFTVATGKAVRAVALEGLALPGGPPAAGALGKAFHVQSVAVAPDGSTVAAVDLAGAVRFWKLPAKP
jgi:WD40 repeat protein